MTNNAISNIDEFYDSAFRPYFLQKRDFLISAGLFFVSFIVYLLTLTPSICAGDSGELTTAIYNLGAAHPPGYPLYTILGKIFTYVPLNDIAYRVNLLSAFFGAFTVTFLFLFLIKIIKTNRGSEFNLKDYIIAGVSSLIFAFSQTHWSQAVIAEVYTLNIIFAPLLLLVVLVWQERVFLQLKKNIICYAERYLLLFALLLGMSFTNHLLLLGYIIPFMIFFLAIFLIIREYAKRTSNIGQTKMWGIVSVIFGVAVSGYLIYKYSWSPRLLHDEAAVFTLAGILLPIIIFGVISVILLFSTPDIKSKARISGLNKVFGVVTALLTLFFVFLMSNDSLKDSLKFMSIRSFDEIAFTMFFITVLMIILFAYMRLRKQRIEGDYFSEGMSISFKAYLFFLIPMFLYLTMIIRANAIAGIPEHLRPLSWGETTYLSKVINHFLRKQYPKASLKFFPRIFEITIAWGKWHFTQFTPLIIAFVPFGLFSIFRRNKLWAYLTSSIFIIFNVLLLYFLSFKVNPRDLFFNEVFFIPSYIILITWVAFGMQFCVEKLSRLIGKDEKGVEPDKQMEDSINVSDSRGEVNE